MNKYIVTLFLVENPMRDAEKDIPETKAIEFLVTAPSKQEAIREAMKLNTTGLSVYESLVL